MGEAGEWEKTLEKSGKIYAKNHRELRHDYFTEFMSKNVEGFLLKKVEIEGIMYI